MRPPIGLLSAMYQEVLLNTDRKEDAYRNTAGRRENMKEKITRKTGRSMERLCIWSLRHHEYILSRIRLYAWLGTATILFFALVTRVTVETALGAILFSGLIMVMVLYLLNERRKVILLRIEDPDLRAEAYAEMLRFLCRRKDKLKSGYPAVCDQIGSRANIGKKRHVRG